MKLVGPLTSVIAGLYCSFYPDIQEKTDERYLEKDENSSLKAWTSVGIGRLDDFANGTRDSVGRNKGRALQAHITGDATKGGAKQPHVVLGAHFIRLYYLWRKSR